MGEGSDMRALEPAEQGHLETRGFRIGYEVFGNIHGPDEHDLVAAMPATMAAHRVDAVVVGNGC